MIKNLIIKSTTYEIFNIIFYIVQYFLLRTTIIKNNDISPSVLVMNMIYKRIILCVIMKITLIRINLYLKWKYHIN